MPENQGSDLTVRSAVEADLGAVEEMVNDNVQGHPAEKHPRSRSALRDAYFGTSPVAHLLVATHGDLVIGMGQWTLIYDMFWGMYGAHAEWLYVRREFRGRGVAAAIIAQICAQVRDAGGEFLRGGADDAEVAALYERVAMGWPARQCYLSAEAFRAFADLADLPPRTIVRRIPSAELNKVPPRERVS
jgi:GNAT superfamily N-acetyltransferase